MSLLATGLALAAAGMGSGEAAGEAPTAGTGPRLSASQLAGQRVVFGFKGLEPPRALLVKIRRGEVAGVILFSRNVRSRAQVRGLVRRLQAIPRPPGLDQPLLVMVDQEGGRVRRIPGAPERSAAAVGASGSSAVARADGRAAARNLRGVGVNVDLAPVIDVARAGSAMERERRSYGRSAAKVERLAGQFAAGLADGRVLATLKHFPGLGAAAANTDHKRVRVRVSRSELRRVDERPYATLLPRGIRLVMLSTAIYPALDGRRPAALSRAIATAELRGRLGFRGVSLTDALGTPATAPFGKPPDVAVRAARAGADLVLYSSFEVARVAARRLRDAIQAGRISRESAERHVRRVLTLRAALQ